LICQRKGGTLQVGLDCLKVGKRDCKIERTKLVGYYERQSRDLKTTSLSPGPTNWNWRGWGGEGRRITWSRGESMGPGWEKKETGKVHLMGEGEED